MKLNFVRFLSASCCCGMLLFAADAAWPDKEISAWNRDDARDLLRSSPWVKAIKPALLRGLTESQRREGGNFTAEGGGKNAGLELSDITGFGSVRDRGAEKTDLNANGIPASITSRWESALPVRTAEIKANEEDAPALDDEDYAVSVYSVPLKGAMYNLDLRTLPTVLKQNSSLKIDGRKDQKPSRVVLRQDGSAIATIIYFFPRSARISLDDKRVLFTALVGRLYLSQYFYPPEMLIKGRLEL